MNLERAFDSLGHDFLFCVLEKFDFGDNFIKWIKILLPVEVLFPVFHIKKRSLPR